MARQALVFAANRDGYGIEQVRHALTVGQLRAMLEDIDDDTLVICGHDSEYTYGTLSIEAEIREECEGEYGTKWETIDTVCAW